MSQKSYNDTPSLYLIPTPIGNLEDITIRALNTLKTVDIILCEDTRDTGKLLSKYDIKKKLVSCHEFNELKMQEKVLDYLRDGLNLGLVTDQGTPIISDPGYLIAKAVIDAGFNVISLPGATAFVPALTISGLAPSPFVFYGFLNAKSSQQKKELEALKKLKYTIIFYEAPHRLETTLKNMFSVLGDRNACLCRELSKKYEEVHRMKISELIPIVNQLKGEFVLIVEGNLEEYSFDELSILEHINLYLEDGMTEKDAIKKVAKERGVAKSIIYKEYHVGK